MTAAPDARWRCCRSGAGSRRGTARPTGWRTAAICMPSWRAPHRPSRASRCAPGFALASLAQHGGDVQRQERSRRRGDGPGPGRRRRPVVERAPRDSSRARAAVRGRHRHAHRHPGRGGGTAGVAGRRTVAESRASTSSHYPVRGGSEIAVVVIATEAWQGTEWDVEADGAALLARLAGFHASLADPLAMAPDVAQVGALSPAPAAALVGRPGHADRRCRASDAAAPGARRRAGAGGRRRAGRLPGRPSRQRGPGVRRLRGASAAAAPRACRP